MCIGASATYFSQRTIVGDLRGGELSLGLRKPCGTYRIGVDFRAQLREWMMSRHYSDPSAFSSHDIRFALSRRRHRAAKYLSGDARGLIQPIDVPAVGQ